MKQNKTKQNQRDPKKRKNKGKENALDTPHIIAGDVTANSGRILNKVLHKSQPSPRDNNSISSYLCVCVREAPSSGEEMNLKLRKYILLQRLRWEDRWDPLSLPAAAAAAAAGSWWLGTEAAGNHSAQQKKKEKKKSTHIRCGGKERKWWTVLVVFVWIVTINYGGV